MSLLPFVRLLLCALITALALATALLLLPPPATADASIESTQDAHRTRLDSPGSDVPAVGATTAPRASPAPHAA